MRLRLRELVDVDDTAKPFVLILSRVDWFGDVIRDRAAKDIAIKE
jgi:hypothetical protein